MNLAPTNVQKTSKASKGCKSFNKLQKLQKRQKLQKTSKASKDCKSFGTDAHNMICARKTSKDFKASKTSEALKTSETSSTLETSLRCEVKFDSEKASKNFKRLQILVKSSAITSNHMIQFRPLGRTTCVPLISRLQLLLRHVHIRA